MKKLTLVAALAALAACQQEAAPAPEATPEATTAAAPAAATLAADGKASTGTFTITTHDGKVYTEVINADGTYSDTDSAGQVVETGRWEQKSPTEFCTTEDKEGAKQRCNTEGIDASGKWTSTNDKGETATVVRVEA